jgi:hypothetical protein
MTPLAVEARELMRRAILTLRAIPADQGPKEFGNPFANIIVREVEESYGWSGARVAEFQPEPRDVSVYLTVLGWLSWYQREIGYRDVKMFFAWAYGVPMWRIAKQSNRSEKTIARRRDDLSETIAKRFAGEIEKMSLDDVRNVGQKGQITDKVGDLPPASATDLPVTPKFVRLTDAVPSHQPETRDHKRTLRRLDKNAQKHKRSIEPV